MATDDNIESDAGIPIDWQVARNFTGGDDALLDPQGATVSAQGAQCGARALHERLLVIR